MELLVSRGSTTVFSILLGLEDQFSTTEDAVVHLHIFGSPQRDGAHFRGKELWQRSSTLFISSSNVFISSAKIVHPQHKTCLSLAVNMIVCNMICIWRWIAKTISSLEMNALICSVKWYSEVSSWDYLVASDKCVCLLLGSWFRNPPKRTETKTSFQVTAGPVKGQKQGRNEKTQEHNPTTVWWCPPFWPPTQCTCIPSSLCLQIQFSANKVN